MFDIGFWELSLIFLVGLVVIGPERLPAVARTVGLWTGRIKGTVQSFKQDLAQEIAADELKKTLEKQNASQPLEEIIEETQNTIADGIESLNIKSDKPDDSSKSS